ncbi:jhy protein homolog [Labrus bergylta]|uniref:jhy protein homolog n=1 Tax=Labrus bergylta TaxID=56723 RepID=UPI003313D5B8
MDKGLNHEKMRQKKTEQEKQQWESVESDTESLAQERAYQQQVQMNISHHDENKYMVLQQENDDSLLSGDTNDGDIEYLHVYDSLEEATHSRAKRSPSLLQRTDMEEREGTSQLLCDDVYSDLRYDPNWRSNLKAADLFQESRRTSVEEFDKVPEETSSQMFADRQGVVIKGGYRYISDTHPAVVVTPPAATKECHQPYRLHPQDPQTGSVTSLYKKQDSQPRSLETHFSSPTRTSTKTDRDTLQIGFRDKHENMRRYPEVVENKHAMYSQEFNAYNQQEVRARRAGNTQTQTLQTFKSNSPKVLSQKKLERLTEDIVERNKVTLGRNKPGNSSYVTVHALKQDVPHHGNKVNEILQEMTSTECEEDSSDPKLRWLQKTQQLRVAQSSKGKKTLRIENPIPPQQKQPPDLGVREKQGHSLSSPSAKPVNVAQPKHLKMSPSQTLPPTIHLNINLNTSSHLLPSQQRGQDAVLNLASIQGCPVWINASEDELALPPRYLQTNQAMLLHMSQKDANPQLTKPNLESGPVAWQRSALKWPLPFESVDEKGSPHGVHCEEFPQAPPGKPTTTSLPGSEVYTVLPPIRISLTESESELSPGQSVNPADSIHRSSSDGYLVQMEKQKQRARGTYKAYSLKDYKQLRSDINLQGLGPNYKAIEKTAEKLKRQRLYSNVIREQNKNISRIPFLPAKGPEGKDKKVPRMKALEYAKTITKPPHPQQRQKRQPEGLTQRAQYLEGLDVFQPAALDVLRKRHEEEKQMVALFRKVHAV